MLPALLLASAITFDQALARAKAQNAELAAGVANQRAAAAGVEVAGQLPNPTVALSVGPDEPKLFGTVEQKLPIFGQRGTAIAAAEREAQAASADLAAQGVKLRAAVRRAFAELVDAQEQAQLAQESLQLSQELSRMAQARLQTGSSTQLEAAQATLALKRAEQEAASRAAARTAAQTELARLLGDDAQQPLSASGEAPLPAVIPEVSTLLRRAETHPEVLSLQLQEAAALARADRERAAVRPIPAVSLEVLQLQSTPGIGLRAGLSFELPLLSWNGGAVHQAQAQAQAAHAQARAGLERLRAELTAARERWQAAATRARSYREEIVPTASQLTRMAREAWQLGRAPLQTAVLAQQDLASARSQAADAVAEAQKAVADLEEGSGEGL